MHFNVYNSDMESIFQAWNSNEEDGTTYVDVKLKDRKLVANHRLQNEETSEWADNAIDIPYEEICKESLPSPSKINGNRH